MPVAGFEYHDCSLHAEGVALSSIAAAVGTPAYVYSAGAITANYNAYAGALARVPHEIHYAVKANSSLGILSLLARLGAGFDIVSAGELFRVLEAGGNPAKVVFSGVGKTAEEIDYALGQGIGAFNCESEAELRLLDEIAGRLGRRPSAALRVNPDINAETHPYIATGLEDHKFGIPIDRAEQIYVDAGRLANIRLEGVSCHIGSQIFDTGVFLEALEAVVALAERLRARGLEISQLDLGGGLAVSYRSQDATPSIETYAQSLASALDGKNLRLMLEPGRSIVGQAGVLLTKVLYRKRTGRKEFVVVDAAMNDLIRPALYQSHHEVIPVCRKEGPEIVADVVGPVCETGDFLARGRKMRDVAAGELLAVCTAGAYGFVLSSNYNSRPRAPEVLVDGAQFHVIRRRETYQDLIRGEFVPGRTGTSGA
jgi:diaminopimelate decarboxylase